MPKHTDLFGQAYSIGNYLAIPYHAIGIIKKLGFSTGEAVVILELMSWSYKGPSDFYVSTDRLAKDLLCTKDLPARAIRKAIKKNLILVISKSKRGKARHYDIRPLISELAQFAPKNDNRKTKLLPPLRQIEKENELIEPKHPMRFGEAILDSPVYDYDPDDIPDEATRGWKHCKECHKYGPPNCSCNEDQVLN
jgi:hypothetical protein